MLREVWLQKFDNKILSVFQGRRNCWKYGGSSRNLISFEGKSFHYIQAEIPFQPLFQQPCSWFTIRRLQSLFDRLARLQQSLCFLILLQRWWVNFLTSEGSHLVLDQSTHFSNFLDLIICIIIEHNFCAHRSMVFKTLLKYFSYNLGNLFLVPE